MSWPPPDPARRVTCGVEPSNGHPLTGQEPVVGGQPASPIPKTAASADSRGTRDGVKRATVQRARSTAPSSGVRRAPVGPASPGSLATTAVDGGLSWREFFGDFLSRPDMLCSEMKERNVGRRVVREPCAVGKTTRWQTASRVAVLVLLAAGVVVARSAPRPAAVAVLVVGVVFAATAVVALVWRRAVPVDVVVALAVALVLALTVVAHPFGERLGYRKCVVRSAVTVTIIKFGSQSSIPCGQGAPDNPPARGLLVVQDRQHLDPLRDSPRRHHR